MNAVRVSLVLFVCLMIPAMMMGQAQPTTSSIATVTDSAGQDRAPHVVTILLTGNAGKKVVTPGRAPARPGDKLHFVLGSKRVLVFFPDGELLFGASCPVFTPDSTGQLWLQLRDSISIRSALGIKSGQVLVREFPYAVYCLDSKEFAEGGSAPVIIIEDSRY